MLAIIGSYAMNHWVKVEDQRKPNDLDIVGTYDEIELFVKHIRKTEKMLAQYPFDSGKKIFMKTDKRIIEAEVAWDNSNSLVLKNLIEKDGLIKNMEGLEIIVCPFNLLYTLKMSHRYLKDSPHFLKTMKDIQLMRSYGAVIPKEYEVFYKERQKIQYNYSLPKLNQNKDSFSQVMVLFMNMTMTRFMRLLNSWISQLTHIMLTVKCGAVNKNFTLAVKRLRGLGY